MNYYISGSSGFIGQAITKYLKIKGERVISIPRGQSINNLIGMFNIVKPDYIIHLGAYGGHYYQKDFIETVNTNIIGTYNLLEAVKEYDYKVFYNFSTSSVDFFDKPTYYSMTKLCAEQLAGMYKNVINVRPYSVYGRGEGSHRLIPKIIECLNSGEQMTLDEKACHDWIYIDSFVEAIFTQPKEKIFKVGTGIKTTNLEVVRILEEISGKKLNYTPGKVRTYDNEDWVCKTGVPDIGLKEGLKRTYEYYS